MTLLATLQNNRAQILAIAAKHGASNVRMFGSVARRKAGFTIRTSGLEVTKRTQQHGIFLKSTDQLHEG